MAAVSFEVVSVIFTTDFLAVIKRDRKNIFKSAENSNIENIISLLSISLKKSSVALL